MLVVSLNTSGSRRHSAGRGSELYKITIHNFHLFLSLTSVFSDVIETTGPCRYIVQESFALVLNGPEFSALKIIVQSREECCPDGTDYQEACFRECPGENQSRQEVERN